MTIVPPRLVRRLRQTLDRVYVSHEEQARALDPVYASQADLAVTLDGLRRSHELALASLRATQETADLLARTCAELTDRLAGLTREIYGPGAGTGGTDPRSLIAALAAGQEVLLNTVAEQSPAEQDTGREPAPVAVIIPTCDRPALLDEALHSVGRQTLVPARVIVVNDGREPVDEVVRAHAAHLPRVDLLNTPHPYSREGVARNMALDALTGEHALYLDDDNVLWPTWVATVAQALAHPGGPGAVYGAQLRTDVASYAGLLYRPYDPAALSRDNYVDTNTLAHRTTAHRWNTHIRRVSDWDFVLQLSATTTIEALPRLASIYRDSAPGRVSDAPGFRLNREAVRLKRGRSGPGHACPVCAGDDVEWQDDACPVCGAVGWERSAAVLVPYLWAQGAAAVLAEPSVALAGTMSEQPRVETDAGAVVLGPSQRPGGVVVDLPATLPSPLTLRMGLSALVLEARDPDHLPDLTRLARDADALARYLESDELADVLSPPSSDESGQQEHPAAP